MCIRDRSCSGVPLLAGGINFQVVHSGLGLTPSFLQRLCEILAFILTVLSGACPAICRGLLRSPTSATQHSTICSVSCVSVAGRCPGLSTSLLNRLQSVINASARSIAGLRRSEHSLLQIYVKKLQFIEFFIHSVNGDGSKTQKLQKGTINHTNIA